MNSIATLPLHSDIDLKKQAGQLRVFLETLGRTSLAALVFIYATAPIWGVRIAAYYGWTTVLSGDFLLLAICWMPAAAAIIHLSFIKPLKGWMIGSLLFTVLNTLVFGIAYGICYAFGFFGF